jgi:hypothetical protein
MTATIKINERTKRQIERIQAKLVIERGEKVSQIDLIDRIFDAVLKHPDIFEEILENKDLRGEKEAWIKRTTDAPDWGVDDSSEDIDKQIAGR